MAGGQRRSGQDAGKRCQELLHRLPREPLAAGETAQALLEIAQGRAFAFFAALGTIEYGSALAASDPRAGIERIREGIAMCRAGEMDTLWTGAHAALAEAWGRAGQQDEGLSVVAEGIALVEETDGRQWEAELHRLQGELLALTESGDAQVEDSLLHALQVARGQEARSLELRAALSLARLWRRQGRRDNARRLLEPLYAWFTEGFATADLRAAREFLDAAS